NKEARTCVIIDPCEELAERIINYVKCQEIKVAAILDTHSHGDHESIRPFLYKVLKPYLLTPNAKPDSLGWIDTGLQITLPNNEKAPAMKIVGELTLAKVCTPGHTIDSCTYILGDCKNESITKEQIKFAFCGDTILSGGIGRSNFDCSDVTKM